MGIARDLYRAFQTDQRITRLDVADVSLLLADVRLHRDDTEKRFMTDADLERVCGWLRGLRGPGFLALGQPVFTTKAGFKGHFFDWGLPDYECQYTTLARALSEVEHSVVILTGDVHYGRIARCSLRTGVELIEIISSPLALVDRRAQGGWSPAPSCFPAEPRDGAVQSPVTTEPFRTNAPHFLTLELHALGRAVELVVRHWPIPPSDEPAGREVLKTRLR
jgi:hypothetical protein